MRALDLRHGDGYGLYMQALETTRERIAHELGVSAASVTPTCGGTGAIDLVLGLFEKPSRIALMANEYYDVHALAKKHGHSVIQANGPENDLRAFREYIKNTPGIGAVYLSLPNNPTGDIYHVALLINLIEACDDAHIALIVDETLVHAEPFPMSSFRMYAPNTRLAVIRSFSKTHGAVTYRGGYVVAPCATMPLHPFSHAPSLSTLQKMWACIEDKSTPALVLKRIKANNQRIAVWARRQELVRWQSSETNFGVLHLEGKLRSADVAAHLRDQGILIKHQGDLHCPGNFLRIPLDASPKQIKRLLDTLAPCLL